ncbi:hypothetical protein BJ165DRAFT_177853 [Panaeolus papilionaceus]|nr:hypothetical protein BJ165DRAFT_177853 [Panaeolus papilionaceus]
MVLVWHSYCMQYRSVCKPVLRPLQSMLRGLDCSATCVHHSLEPTFANLSIISSSFSFLLSSSLSCVIHIFPLLVLRLAFLFLFCGFYPEPFTLSMVVVSSPGTSHFLSLFDLSLITHTHPLSPKPIHIAYMSPSSCSLLHLFMLIYWTLSLICACNIIDHDLNRDFQTNSNLFVLGFPFFFALFFR